MSPAAKTVGRVRHRRAVSLKGAEAGNRQHSLAWEKLLRSLGMRRGQGMAMAIDAVSSARGDMRGAKGYTSLPRDREWRWRATWECQWSGHRAAMASCSCCRYACNFTHCSFESLCGGSIWLQCAVPVDLWSPEWTVRGAPRFFPLLLCLCISLVLVLLPVPLEYSWRAMAYSPSNPKETY